MKTLRITIASSDVAKQDEESFKGDLTDRLISAGFNLNDPIIKQPRSDVKAMDFIQFKYSILDKWDVQIQDFMWKIEKWVRINLLNNE
jgi:hypothetical protein